MKLSLYVCEMCGKDYATSPYTRGIEEGRRQMREEAVQVCRHEAEGWRKQNCDPWANAVGACAISIQAIPVKKE